MQTEQKIGLIGAISIGVGGMVGGGIFAVLGEAVSLAHGATALAFLFAGLVALFTAYSYAKLSVTYPDRGGTVSYIDKVFGNNYFSGTINVVLWLSYLVTISLYSVAFASYAATFFPSQMDSSLLKHGLISFAIVLPALINYISVAFVENSEKFFVFLKLAILLLIIVTGVSTVDTERLSTKYWGDTLSIIVAGMIIFVAYEGFELIANAAEDIKNPQKNLPRAFYASVIFVIMLYVAIALITIGAVPEKQLLEAKDYALAIAAKPALGQIGFTLVSVAALLATFSAINATIYGNARLGFMLAKDGELPEKLAREDRQIPTVSVIVTMLLSLLLANSIDLNEIAIIGSASFLLIFFIVNIAAFHYSKTIKANRIILFLAIIISGSALVTLLLHTYKKNQNAILIFLSFILFALVFEIVYGKFIRKNFLDSVSDKTSTVNAKFG